MTWGESARIAMIKKNMKVGDLCRLTGYCRQHIYSILNDKYDPLPMAAAAAISHILEIDLPDE